MSLLQQNPLKVVYREDWGARNPKNTLPLKHPVTDVICTYTRTESCFSEQSCKHFVKRFQKYHQSVKKRLDIAYNFLVGFDGTVYEGRGWHCYTELYFYIPKNISISEGIHIALIGNFKDKKPPPIDMIKAMKCLIRFGIANNYIAENFKMHLF